jgi:hypothetical protein
MPGRGTPKQTLRVPDDLWERFGQVAGDTRRATVLREFMRWYVGEAGARLPKRPA